MTDDARKHPRSPLEVIVDWQLLDSTDVIWSTTGDVSSGGLRIRTLAPPAEGAGIRLVMSLADDQSAPVEVHARVAWTRMADDFCGMGVAFEPADAAQQAALDALLRQLEATSRGDTDAKLD